MHELSIATSIVETVLQEIQRQNLPPVQTIAVRIGALSSVDPEALRFGYEAITPDTPLANTKLEIEFVPVQAKCRACGQEFAVEDFVFACPLCDSGQIEVMRGEELDIAYLEVENDKLNTDDTD
ncbi:MAG: hydrogenase maturation nickel metallochaperone HypA [candidate division KSB1 bacterium]|nr:hydrogenase maturation nickel metallochaperone HypA [candidate division KSB1 bacterium]MDZ7304305.1 hydrogenase maturation nickel metallochaperone HypA [candidate division KSB1 bacterium]MDZ7313582.1 hydrogenase maturation nickel metallochaperone HypA [candidate division KSB1 bacterium]